MIFLILFWMSSSEEYSMKFQSIALMIQHAFKSLKTIKSPTAWFTVRIIKGETILFKQNLLKALSPDDPITMKQPAGDFIVFKFLKVCWIINDICYDILIQFKKITQLKILPYYTKKESNLQISVAMNLNKPIYNKRKIQKNLKILQWIEKWFSKSNLNFMVW